MADRDRSPRLAHQGFDEGSTVRRLREIAAVSDLAQVARRETSTFLPRTDLLVEKLSNPKEELRESTSSTRRADRILCHAWNRVRLVAAYGCGRGGSARQRTGLDPDRCPRRGQNCHPRGRD